MQIPVSGAYAHQKMKGYLHDIVLSGLPESIFFLLYQDIESSNLSTHSNSS